MKDESWAEAWKSCELKTVSIHLVGYGSYERSRLSFLSFYRCAKSFSLNAHCGCWIDTPMRYLMSESLNTSIYLFLAIVRSTSPIFATRWALNFMLFLPSSTLLICRIPRHVERYISHCISCPLIPCSSSCYRTLGRFGSQKWWAKIKES